ncbi:MAG: hypothetical protein RIC57_07995 [Balneola sp.]|jgi:hypothetical protein|tara:strand:- start:20122 stop:20532 length:411 start_codon:yes stop_codon:yes gene_type:complete
MGFFKNDKKGKPPHKIHPEVLHWKENDEIENIDFQKMERKSKFNTVVMRIDGVTPMTIYLYKSLTNDGFIIVEEKETQHLHKIEFERFVEQCNNLSLKSRWIEQDLDHSKEYMELIESFQKAYSELEESDKPKLLD